MIRRNLTRAIKSLIDQYPILAVTGPRQSGKTTLLRNLFPSYEYVSLEDLNIRSFAQEDPVGFLSQYEQKVIFDEVQRVPSIFPYLQTRVDERGIMGQFILSGSQNFHFLEHITQSLAGRVAIFKLLPFDFNELQSAEVLPENWKGLLLKGFYPAIYDRNMDPSIYYSNYLQTYIELDVSSLINIHDMQRFRNFISLCADRSGQLVNFNNLARDGGISPPTAKSWLTLLERSYILFLLQPYFENFSKRVIKSPKMYFYDTGLVSFLLGMRAEEDFTDRTLVGQLFENMIVADLIKQNHHQYTLKEYYFWRDTEGHEIDVLTKMAGKFDIYEIKSTQTIQSKLFRPLNYFETIAKEDQVRWKILIYGGEKNQSRTDYDVRAWRSAFGRT